MKKIHVRCGSDQRRQQVKDKGLNGIDYLEVFPTAVNHKPLLFLYCFNSNNLSDIDKNKIMIKGGVRIKQIKSEWVKPANIIKNDLENNVENEITKDLSSEEVNELTSMFDTLDNGDDNNNNNSIVTASSKQILIIRPSSDGDFSTYKLLLVSSPDSVSPPAGFDVILSSIDFNFKIECLEDFDCRQEMVCPPEVLQEPVIDYIAKDYSSFRKLMLDRLASIMPQWKERNAADQSTMLIELLAYVGDHLSYYQDTVATEAYLGTARKRISMRRHSRLLGYFIDSGCNARAWIHFAIDGGAADGIKIPEKTKLLTGNVDEDTVIQDESELDRILKSAHVFETMHEITAYNTHNEIQLYTWSDINCCLPKGATRATLKNPNNSLKLKVGDYLVFEEIASPNGVATDADPEHRQVVRITEVVSSEDPLNSTPVLEIAWDPDDALYFPLCIDKDGAIVSIVRGNIVLADHGSTVRERLDIVSSVKLRPKLSNKPLTYRCPFNRSSPASLAIKHYDYGDGNGIYGDDDTDNNYYALPDIYIEEYLGSVNCNSKFPAKSEHKWHPRTDLLSSNKFERSFVVEMENGGSAQIRFGDNVLGMEPLVGSGADQRTFCATYRIGNGREGNVGAESIRRIVKTDTFSVSSTTKLRNPLPATGGRDPESIEEVRQYAPEAFRTQRRAVTEADYEIVLKRHPEVQGAKATIRWTGSWYTVFVAIDRIMGREVDEKFKSKMLSFLENYRLAGYDLEINSPIYVPVEIMMSVCVDRNHIRAEVEKALIEEFSNRRLSPDGRLGFFHPDNFTFGQKVFLSKIYERAMSVDGVSSVLITRFGRLRRPGEDAIDTGVLEIEPLEEARLDNDPNFPENGKIDFIVQGGR